MSIILIVQLLHCPLCSLDQLRDHLISRTHTGKKVMLQRGGGREGEREGGREGGREGENSNNTDHEKMVKFVLIIHFIIKMRSTIQEM